MLTRQHQRFTYYLLLHWLARITALILFGIVMLFLIGEGGPSVWTSGTMENLLHLAFAVMVFGLIFGWLSDGAGGGLVLGGWLMFYVLNYLASGKFPSGALPLFAVPGILYVASSLIDHWPRRVAQT